MEKELKIAVLGGGSWATAIVKMLTENQDKVIWYMRNEDALEYIKANRHNPNYLTSVEFQLKQLVLTNNMDEAVSMANLLIFAIPSAILESELKKLTIP